jgi:arginine decarboxylase
MVPGQVINAETIEFMRKLDVKEIHGYNASLGLKLLKPSFVESLQKVSTNGKAKKGKAESKLGMTA